MDSLGENEIHQTIPFPSLSQCPLCCRGLQEVAVPLFLFIHTVFMLFELGLDLGVLILEHRHSERLRVSELDCACGRPLLHYGFPNPV